jgi:hypothetical protein
MQEHNWHAFTSVDKADLGVEHGNTTSRMIVFRTNRHGRVLQLWAAGSQSLRSSVSVRLSVGRWPVVLYEEFQAGEHQAPVPFRTRARLIGEIVVLMQQYACLLWSVA